MVLLDDDYYISNTGMVWIIFLSVTALFIFWGIFTRLRNDLKKKDSDLEKKNLEIGKIQSDLQLNVNNLAHKEAQIQFEKWKASELLTYQKMADETSLQAAGVLLQRWKIEEEEKFRKDAVTRSMGVNLGKITEHLIPFSANFKQFNPRDARFMGNPIDLIVFDGIAEKKDIVTVYLVEVKTGTSALNENQKKVKAAVDANRVLWHQITLPEFKWDVKE